MKKQTLLKKRLLNNTIKRDVMRKKEEHTNDWNKGVDIQVENVD